MPIDIYNDEAQGLEGFYIVEGLPLPYGETGATGFYIVEGLAVPYGETGTTGFYLEYLPAERFLKITDFRGIPLANCEITVKNIGGDYIITTDETGVAFINVDTL